MGEHSNDLGRTQGDTDGRVVVATARRGRAEAALNAGSAAGRAIGATVHGLHVLDDAVDTDPDHVRDLAAAAGVDVDVRRGGTVEILAEAMAADDVRLTVIAADGWEDDPLDVRAVMRSLLERAPGPVLLVPRGCSPSIDHRHRRVLVPHDGTGETADAVDHVIASLRDAGLEVVLLHVLDPEHVPPCIDHPRWGVETWSHEFLARHADVDVERDLVLCAGEASGHVLEAVERRDADLVLVGWAQDLSDGRAAVVRELIERSTVPLLLVRVDRAAPHEPVGGVVPVTADAG